MYTVSDDTAACIVSIGIGPYRCSKGARSLAKETITLSLEGDIPIDLFAKVMGHFSALVESLSDEILGSEKIEWQIEALAAGSATATIRGFHNDANQVAKVVLAYETVGRSLEGNTPIPYSENVTRSAYAITSVLNGHIRAVRFITDEVATLVSAHREIDPDDGTIPYSLGVITGRVDAIWNRPTKLGVYDALFNRVVYCYLDNEQQEIARQAWGAVVAVTGMVRRDVETGRPIEVRQVKSVDIRESARPYSFRQARGALSWQEGDEPAEVLIRRVRDVIE